MHVRVYIYIYICVDMYILYVYTCIIKRCRSYCQLDSIGDIACWLLPIVVCSNPAPMRDNWKESIQRSSTSSVYLSPAMSLTLLMPCRNQQKQYVIWGPEMNFLTNAVYGRWANLVWDIKPAPNKSAIFVCSHCARSAICLGLVLGLYKHGPCA